LGDECQSQRVAILQRRSYFSDDWKYRKSGGT
jgi:hypothetical protein